MHLIINNTSNTIEIVFVKFKRSCKQWRENDLALECESRS